MQGGGLVKQEGHKAAAAPEDVYIGPARASLLVDGVDVEDSVIVIVPHLEVPLAVRAGLVQVRRRMVSVRRVRRTYIIVLTQGLVSSYTDFRYSSGKFGVASPLAPARVPPGQVPPGQVPTVRRLA